MLKIRCNYTASDIENILRLLHRRGTFRFPRFKNGLFPAAGFDRRKFSFTGYQNVWVRDNFHVAYAHYVTGQPAIAVKNARALAAFFQTQRPRFLNVIHGKTDPAEPMNRPHIRFDSRGHDLKQKWSHAQNDALGGFLWFYSKLMLEGAIRPSRRDLELLALFPPYFEAIRYWKDADNGHWEEERKVEASSIGVVVAALQMLERAMAIKLDSLIEPGLRALRKILPAESVQPGHARKWDSALLFLIYPMEIVTGKMADQIVKNVTTHLQGEYGIRRYLHDSYWAADYKERLPKKKRSTDYSLTQKKRDTLFHHAPEAQWCLFDPIISIIYGKKYQRTKNPLFLRRQTEYLNRALKQVTEDFLCPEAYYMEAGRYVPNDQTPLLWTQANLLMALHVMKAGSSMEP